MIDFFCFFSDISLCDLPLTPFDLNFIAAGKHSGQTQQALTVQYSNKLISLI